MFAEHILVAYDCELHTDFHQLRTQDRRLLGHCAGHCPTQLHWTPEGPCTSQQRGLYRPGPQTAGIYRASEAAGCVCKGDTFLELHFTLCWSLLKYKLRWQSLQAFFSFFFFCRNKIMVRPDSLRMWVCDVGTGCTFDSQGGNQNAATQGG